MIKRLSALLVSFGVAVGTVLAQSGQKSVPPSPEPADTIIKNAYIFTSAKKPKSAEAVAIKDGKFIFVGKNKKVQNYKGPNTVEIDAGGCLITPGFIDAHTHVAWLGMLSCMMTMVYDAQSVDGGNGKLSLKSLIQDFAAQNPDMPFIFAIGWKYDYIPNGIPTKEMADEILKDRPLILWSHDGHTGWVNSMALEDMQKSNPKAFEYLTPDYDNEKKPTGIFRHFYAINPMDFYTLGEDMLDKMAAALKAKLAEGLAVGVTAHHDVMIHSGIFNYLLEMDKRNAFENTRLRGAYFVNHHQYLDDKNAIYKILDEWKALAENSTEHFIVGEAVKLGIDGVSANYTAFLSEPYSDDPDNYGVASYEAAEFNELAKYIDSMKLQICTHAVGDAGITRVIDGYENALKMNGKWDSRHTIEHCSMINNKDIKRAKKLDIYVSDQPAHYYGDETTVKRIGKERFINSHRFGTMQKAKVKLAFGTDYSIVPMNPLYGILVATTRISCLGWPTTKTEKREIISVGDAIRHYTIGSAKAMKIEDITGSIEVGKRADLVVFSIDFTGYASSDAKSKKSPLPIDLDGLVLMTMVDGKIVYQK